MAIFLNRRFLKIGEVVFSRGKYQNCHLVLQGSFWFFLILFLVLFSSVFGSLVFFFFFLVLQVLSGLQRSENQSLVLPVPILVNLKPDNILKSGEGGCQCLSYRSLLEWREGLDAF